MKQNYTKVNTIKQLLNRGIRNKGMVTFLLVATSVNLMAQEAPKETKDVKTVDVSKPSYVVKGRVMDEKGQPLEGATILVKGTNLGTLSDKYGDFTIRVPEGFDVLMVSHVTMKFQEINVKGKASIKVQMESSGRQLDEIVVVAYGKQQKKDVVTSVSTIKAEEIMQENQTNIANALQGKVTGATVISSRGTPGKTRPQILIRGVNPKQTPLIVVDGVPRYNDNNTNSVGLTLNGLTIDDINPDEVESISVLKDNAATAVYGTRGSFGVIVITTKRGKIGKPQFSYSTNFSMDEPANFPKLFDSYKWALVDNEYKRNSGQAISYNDSVLNVIRYGLDPAKYANESLYDRMVQRTAMQQTHSMSVRGGTESVRYYINGSFNDQKGIISAFDSKRYTIQSNVDIKISNDIKLGLSTGFRTTRVSSAFNQTGDAVFGDLFLSSPLTPFYNKDGSIYGTSEYNNKLVNTMPDIAGSRVNRSNNISIQSNFEYSPSFIEGLTFKLNNSLNFNAADYKAYQKFYNTYVPDASSPTGYRKTGGFSSNKVEEQLGSANFFNTDLGFDYSKAFKKHRIGLMVLGTNYYTNSLNTTVSRDGLVGNLENISSGRTLNQTTAGNESESGRVGGLARLNYDFAGKYSLEYSMRADASDNFPKAHRWGFFSGGAVAWRLSQEKFIKDNLRFVNDFKIRASLGYTGIDNLTAANYYYSYNIATSGPNGGAGYSFGGTYQPSFILNTSNIPNVNVTWGKSLMRNLGVDFSLWSGLLSGTFDIYDKKVSDLPKEKLLTIPATFGIGAPLFNFAKEKYNGYEVSLTNNTKFGKEMSLQTSLSFQYTKSRAVDYGELPETKEYLKKEGHSILSKAFYQSLGIFQTQEEINNYDVNQDGAAVKNSTLKPGDIKYADLNGDKKIDANDQIVYDNTVYPPYSGGLNLTFRYKSFSVNAFFQGAGGNMVTFAPNIYTDYGYNNSWRPDNTDARYPRISSSSNNLASFRPSTHYLNKGDYIRFKNLGFAYNVPVNLVKRIGLSNVSISASVLNLMSFSTVKDIDPEVMENASTSGGYYPIQRNYSLGINVGL
ncbi:SusC/RagA family TonB-linked outer membrane protein [Solitalea lacus]|uniref:SusC/RagA family TonB-linked outer membrane protein n=1 Tax=Solitalea lacus TaxID=2911172 RepID=UPI001EDAAE62|nr:TonB-dependent receptor [Solitalea lacus]UKJ06790.1 TonB-dependent receptor [Solitalea lacus]